jgi:hypothetical protein
VFKGCLLRRKLSHAVSASTSWNWDLKNSDVERSVRSGNILHVCCIPRFTGDHTDHLFEQCASDGRIDSAWKAVKKEQNVKMRVEIQHSRDKYFPSIFTEFFRYLKLESGQDRYYRERCPELTRQCYLVHSIALTNELIGRWCFAVQVY